MKNILLITLAIITLSLSSCKKSAQQVTQNGNFKLEYLFTQDDCKMYRFKDGSRYIYWSDCRGKTQSDYSVKNGKTTTEYKEETITTE